MTSFLILLLLNILSILCAQGGVYDEGSHPTGYVEYSKNFTGLDHHLGVHAPNAPGIFPVIYFSSGLADIQPASTYRTLFSRVASHGYVVIMPFHLSNPNNEYEADWLFDIMDWCERNLLDALITESGFNLGLNIDFVNQYLSGHSAGSHVMCEFLKKFGCSGTKGLILMSPVDGADPWGVVDNFCITEGVKLNFETPTVILPGGLDSIPVGEIGPPCAPADMSNDWYYNAMTGPAWMINATEYGHVDMCDFEPGSIFENSCTENQNDTSLFKDYVAGEYAAFLNGVTYGDCGMFNYLEDPALIPVDVEITLQRAPTNPCNNGYCTWLPPIP